MVKTKTMLVEVTKEECIRALGVGSVKIVRQQTDVLGRYPSSNGIPTIWCVYADVCCNRWIARIEMVKNKGEETWSKKFFLFK